MKILANHIDGRAVVTRVRDNQKLQQVVLITTRTHDHIVSIEMTLEDYAKAATSLESPCWLTIRDRERPQPITNKPSEEVAP